MEASTRDLAVSRAPPGGVHVQLAPVHSASLFRSLCLNPKAEDRKPKTFSTKLKPGTDCRNESGGQSMPVGALSCPSPSSWWVTCGTASPGLVLHQS